jgi:hypothetical protein
MNPALRSDTARDEALFILRSLKENGRLGRSNKLADVKSALEPSVSREFDAYFFFLRKFHYIAMDREAQLKLTDEGERLAQGENDGRFEKELASFFGEANDGEEAQENTQSGIRAFVEPDEIIESKSSPKISLEDALPQPPPAPPRSRKGPQTLADEPLVAAPPPPMPVVAPLPPAPPPMPVAAAAPIAPVTSTAPTAQLAAIPKGIDLDGRYTKFDSVGQGPLGTVHKGKHGALGLEVALKELKDIFGYFSFLQRGEVLKRLKKEICAQAAVRHPSVVQVLDQNVDGVKPYVVLELLQGSLRERLDAAGGKGLPAKDSVRIFLQLCYALRAAHAHGLTHHNLKPENVLFDGMGNAKLGDFGLLRVVEVDASKGMPQVFVGTGGMTYLAPELITRSKDAGAAADVYSLGILFYEMLTGQIPGRRSPLPSEVNKDVPQKLDGIFDKMTQDRIEARYPDFDAVLADFYSAFSTGEYLGRGDLILSSNPR